MSSAIAKAIGRLIMENREILEPARAIGSVAAFRMHRMEQVTAIHTGERVYRWQIEFKGSEDLETFDNAIRALVDAAAEEAG